MHKYFRNIIKYLNEKYSDLIGCQVDAMTKLLNKTPYTFLVWEFVNDNLCPKYNEPSAILGFI